jgi:hypothetical protein
MRLIILLCGLLSSEILLDLLARYWLKVSKENLMVKDFYIVMFHIGNFLLLIGTGYPYDFIVGLAKVD